MRNVHRVATAFERHRNAARQPAGHYGKLRDWQIAEAEDDEAALSLFCLARAGAAATRPVSKKIELSLQAKAERPLPVLFQVTAVRLKYE